MSQRGPLHGVVIAVARPRERSADLGTQLEQCGATVLYCPAIRIAPPDSWETLDACLQRLDSYRCLIFTSVPAVEAASSRLRALDSALRTSTRVAAVGAVTARRVEELLGRVDVVGDSDAAALAEMLPIESGDRALFVCGDRARSALPDALADRGVHLDRVVAYRTIANDLQQYVKFARAHPVDVVILSSPSSAEAFASALRDHDLSMPPVIAIGATTAGGARECGFDVAAIAEHPSAVSIVEATLGWRRANGG